MKLSEGWVIGSLLKNALTRTNSSLRRRLLIQLLLVAALLSTLLYFAVRSVADKAAEATHDNILGASTTSIAEQLRASDDEILVDIPYSAFSMLGAISEDKVFYRIDADGVTLTGYDDLPLPDEAVKINAASPSYTTSTYLEETVRIAALSRVIPVKSQPVSVLVLVAQTRSGQDAIANRVANTAAALGIGFFIIAGILSWIAIQSAVSPLHKVADALGRRGAHDLRPLKHPVPQELEPLVGALNSFIARLRGALNRTETFITEAAHHVRTPLATVRTQAEIALRQTETDSSRKTLRSVIRAVDESSRSATQLLDHAMVTYRSDQMARNAFNYSALVCEVIRSTGITADLKDLTIKQEITDNIRVMGDQILVENALRNLLDNAIKYSPPETTITIKLITQTDQYKKMASLSLCDQGRGLGGMEQSSLTQRFGRGGNVKDIVGSGLGLTIVDEVTRAHAGYFEISARTGGGTCALMQLPQH